MTKDNAIDLMKDKEFLDKYCRKFVCVDGKFLEPRGGYIISAKDRENTRFCINKIATDT